MASLDTGFVLKMHFERRALQELLDERKSTIPLEIDMCYYRSKISAKDDMGSGKNGLKTNEKKETCWTNWESNPGPPLNKLAQPVAKEVLYH